VHGYIHTNSEDDCGTMWFTWMRASIRYTVMFTAWQYREFTFIT